MASLDAAEMSDDTDRAAFGAGRLHARGRLALGGFRHGWKVPMKLRGQEGSCSAPTCNMGIFSDGLAAWNADDGAWSTSRRSSAGLKLRPRNRFMLQVYVEHNRAPHSERQSLLGILRTLQEGVASGNKEGA